jgi:hypothetical protein
MMYFLYNGLRYYSFRKFCLDNDVCYSSARYILKTSQSLKNKYELNSLLMNNPDLLDMVIDRYSRKRGDK